MSQKWNLQDIRPSGPRKLSPQVEQSLPPRQDIAVRRNRPSASMQPDPTASDPDLGTIDILDGNHERRKRLLISAAIVLVIVLMGVFINSMKSGAEITVYPKYKDSTVQATFIAYAEPKAGELGYELLSLEDSGERQVEAAGEQLVSERATGKIFIYNAYSTSPQRLIKNTRFESPEGLIFKIQESVEIPGATKDAQGGLVPGVITAEVFADGTGEQYNIHPTRFTIPGLKNSPDQYQKVYGESTETMAGGYEGKKFMIDEAQFKTAQQALQLELRNSLLEKLKTQRPAGFVLYDGAVTFTFTSLPATEYGNGVATIKEVAKLNVPVFAEPEFAAYLARHTVSNFENASVSLPDPLALTFSYTKPTTTLADISREAQLEFDLKGTTRIVWNFDEAKLKSDLAGKPKKDVPNIIKYYPELTRFEVDIKPFWKNSFPEKLDKISVMTTVGDKTD